MTDRPFVDRLGPQSTGWTGRASSRSRASTRFAHPSVLHDGATTVMWFTGYTGATPAIGRITSASTSFSRAAAAVTLHRHVDLRHRRPEGSRRRQGRKHVPDALHRPGVGRGRARPVRDVRRWRHWARQGVALNPSQQPYGFDETAVEPSGMLVDGSLLHVWTTGIDRTGRTRGGHATTAYPLPVSPQDGIPNGWATYQLGDATTTVRDFRSITRTSSGTGVTLWMSFLQPYSSSGNEFWSDYFPVTVDDPAEALHFLLTVRGVRWQARLSGRSGAPSLDKVEIAHAPVSFSPTGEATTTDITPPAGQAITRWGDLTASSDDVLPRRIGLRRRHDHGARRRQWRSAGLRRAHHERRHDPESLLGRPGGPPSAARAFRPDLRRRRHATRPLAQDPVQRRGAATASAGPRRWRQRRRRSRSASRRP